MFHVDDSGWLDKIDLILRPTPVWDLICNCQLDQIFQTKFGLRPDIGCDLEDQTEFWNDHEDQTECLS